MVALVWLGCGAEKEGGDGGTGGDKRPGTGGSGSGGTGAGPGGAGGQGSGGEGGHGTGGMGGSEDVICGGGLRCAQGETCNELDECACDPAAAACGAGRTCDATLRRCVQDFDGPREFRECRHVGEKVDGPNLECVRTGSGRLVWMRMCKTSDDCALGYTACFGHNGSSHCYSNSCGYQDGFEYPNGEFFGECDTATGRYSLAGTKQIGACQMLWVGGQVLGLCVPGGSAGLGATCRADYFRKDPSRVCELGLSCLAYVYSDRFCEDDAHCAQGQACNVRRGRCEMKACSKDADCGTDDNLYCNSEGICELSGTCLDYCNGGWSQDDRPFASCTADPNGVCPTNLTGGRDAAVFCESPCDPFGGQQACPPLGGQARICAPWSTRNAPAGGQCELLADEPVALGEDCSSQVKSRRLVCEPGSICITEGKSTCTALCDCEAGFRAGVCQESTAQCSGKDVCRFVQGISENNRIGVCGSQG